MAAERAARAQPWVNLHGRRVLVVGGTGSVGEGVVRVLLGEGARVIATGRRQERLAELAAQFDDPALVVVPLDGLDPALDDRLGELAEAHGPFDGAVVSVASWGSQGRKPVLALTDEEWDELVAANQTSVFRLYRSIMPRLTRDGVLIQLNGLSADLPFPGNAGVALTAAATKSLTRTLAAELGGPGPRAYEVILGVVRTVQRKAAGIDDARWLAPEDVGAHVARLVAGSSELQDVALHYLIDPADGARAG